MSTLKLKYELYKETHLSGILNLWKNHTDWGSVSESDYKKWIEAPYENCLVVVITSESGEVYGQTILTPTRVKVNQRTVKAIRFSAPILRKELRDGNLLSPEHPINQSFALAFKLAIERGYSLVYLNPFESWTRVLKISHKYGFPKFEIETFSYYQITSPFKGKEILNYSIKEFEDFTVEHELLWEFAGKGNRIKAAICRSEKWLKYKADDFEKIAVYEKDQLVGVIIFNSVRKLLYDVFAVNREQLKITLQLGVNWYFENHMSKEQNAITFLGSKTLLEACSNLEIHKIEYNFTFAYAPLTSKLTQEIPFIDEWYLTSLD